MDIKCYLKPIIYKDFKKMLKYKRNITTSNI